MLKCIKPHAFEADDDGEDSENSEIIDENEKYAEDIKTIEVTNSFTSC